MVTKGIVLFMLVILFASTDAATCGYDDAKLNRPTIGCILSCKVQGCETGACYLRDSRPICVCKRC
uniref:ASABF-epsilon n=1 Tax=Ascaris suum TaxID=6253 RepID=Q8IAC9_ASCSU|nr:ASABF-epsilon [Ascaris suum]BAC57591.1 ASABF-epsilon2 [Ascaris suum]